MNPRQMKQMMSRMGIKTEEMEAKKVVISCADKDVIIENPEVMKMMMPGQTIYNVTGGTISEQLPSDEEPALEISEEDVQMVAEQAGVTPSEAKKALEDSNGDIAEAIIKLKG